MRHDTIGLVSARPAAANLGELVRLRRVRDRMDREYAEPLDVESLARGVQMSAGHLSRQFKLAYGEAPYSYLMTRRIERAMALLRRGDMSVTDVCFEVGCSSMGTFSTRFTELVGVQWPAGSLRVGSPWLTRPWHCTVSRPATPTSRNYRRYPAAEANDVAPAGRGPIPTATARGAAGRKRPRRR